MTAAELVDALSRLPPDLPVKVWCDDLNMSEPEEVGNPHVETFEMPACIVLDWV